MKYYHYYENRDKYEAFHTVKEELEEDLASMIGISSWYVSAVPERTSVDPEFCITIESPPEYDGHVLPATPLSDILMHGLLKILRENTCMTESHLEVFLKDHASVGTINTDDSHEG